MSSTTSILCKIAMGLFSGMLPTYSFPQCSATSAVGGSSFATQSLSGSSYNWSNSNYLNSSDNNRASASAVVGLLTGKTNYLTITGFSFAIPPGSGICGIKVEIEKSGTNIGLFTSIQDNEIRLLKNGIITGNNNATNTDWTGTDTYYSYGGTTDKWGAAWSLSDINSGNFGVAISAQIAGIVGVFPSARVDHVQVTVYYNLILPITLTSFSATAINNTITLKWQTPEPANDQSFIVQRSADGTTWESLWSTIQHDPWLKEFELIDKNPLPVSYYRIKTESKSGVIQYSDIRKRELHSLPSVIVYPNPASNTIYLKNAGKAGINIYNVTGQLVARTHLLPTANSINISRLKPGLYFIITDDNSQKITFQKSGR